MDTDIASADLQRLFGVNRTALNDLTKRRIIERGDKRGFYKLEASVSGYCAHLRGLAQGRHGTEDAITLATVSRGKLAEAQATLAETKAKQLVGELVEAAEVEALWTRKLKGFRNRILGIGDRIRSLPPREHVKLTGELRAALTELADEGSSNL